MEEADRLKALIASTVNAARRNAQKDWDLWDRQHMGVRWHAVREAWPARKRMATEIAREETAIAVAEVPQAEVEPTLRALTEMGLLEGGVLTALGTAATEVNEGHPILMAKLFASGAMKGLDADDTLTVLAGFLEGDGGSPARFNIPKGCLDALYEADRIAADCCIREKACGVISPDSYWNISTKWIEPIRRWLTEDTDIATLCAEYEVFEGNFMRSLMKMANLLEEWRSLATLATDTETLETLRGVEERLMRGVAVCDSLYLRI
jgi:superfamily II RNA helicase